MSPTVLGVLFIAVMLSAVAAVFIWKATHGAIIPWQPMHIVFTVGGKEVALSVSYIAPKSVTEPAVAGALLRAVTYLSEFGPWALDLILFALKDASIFVVDGTEWTDPWGQKVGGETFQGTMYVVRDLSSMCHELARLCEIRIDGKSDYDRVHWVERGISKADEAYRKGTT